MRSSQKYGKQICEYMLTDYNFLADYEIIQANLAENECFLAKIKDSQQKVRFIKQVFRKQDFQRFKSLSKLFKNGVILADNMFILEECGQLYYYIIQAQIEKNDQRFQTLQSYLNNSQISHEQMKSIIAKIKVLIDCLHEDNQAFGGLDTRKIIIDDQKHVYLTPFSLILQLDVDNMSMAYYPPQILQKMERKQTQFSESDIIKWDIWAFGCICLEILLYYSPFFMATSIKQQISLIKKSNIQTLLIQVEDFVANLVINSLRIDQNERIISIHKKQTRKPVLQNLKIEQIIKKQPQKQLHENKVIASELRQLNLHRHKQQGDSQLIFTIFSISNLVFEKQLHITINLNKKYHLYIDSHQDGSTIYKINKRITIRNNFSQFLKLLNDPIIIQLKQQNKITNLKISLQSLIIVYEGLRIWDQPLIGTYTTCDNTSFPKVKFKLSCTLTSPKIINMPENSFDFNVLDSTKKTKKSQKCSVNAKPLSKQVIQRNNKQNQIQRYQVKQFDQNKDKILSISQITQDISNLAQHWKKKNAIEDNEIDDTKQKLQNLLSVQNEQQL